MIRNIYAKFEEDTLRNIDIIVKLHFKRKKSKFFGKLLVLKTLVTYDVDGDKEHIVRV
jgi:hypothetical protein